MRQGDQADQEAQRYIENVQPMVNRNNNGMVAARRAIACKVGAAMVDGRGIRAAADDRGQPRAINQARDDCNPKQNLVCKCNNNPHHVRDTYIVSYHKTLHVPYCTVLCKIP